MVNIGGWRRVEDGETFVYLRNRWGQPELLFEVYANIPG